MTFPLTRFTPRTITVSLLTLVIFARRLPISICIPSYTLSYVPMFIVRSHLACQSPADTSFTIYTIRATGNQFFL
ncbi:hypothetical protein BC835DRAFT_1014895 [Cytidiella melzeri]|nr:hypothetical protein BC835DRAFT_1014895 [Cytidiella melzeri]